MPSPPSQLPPQLKWHNTLPAHFSDSQTPRTLATPGRRAEKRQQPSPDALRAWNEGGDLHPTAGSSGNIPSPTKRHRTIGRASGSNLTTPTKASAGNYGSSSFSSAGSGMQTPPPSGSSMSKKRTRAPRGIPSFDSPRVSATSPVSSPSKGARYIKPTRTVDSAKVHASPLNPSTSGSKEAATNELYETKSAILDADTSIDWSSFDDEGIHTRSMTSDLFLHSDMAYGDLADPMTFSFNCPNDFDDDSLPSIDPNLIFSSRPTSDGSSIPGGYNDDTDVLSSSSIANEQPYQHQYDYIRREKALELQKTQKRKEKATRRRLGDDTFTNPQITVTADGSLRRSFNENIMQPSPSFRAASLDEAVSRQGSVARGRENTTPAPSARNLQPKTEVKLLISPSGRAKTETKVVYDESDTEPDETFTSGNSVDESIESDSSFDEATPRGLGPGGKPYREVRKSKNAGLSGHRGPKLGLFSTAPYSCSSSNPDWSVLEDPSSPVRTMGKPVARSTTRTSGVSQTPHRFSGRSLDECILSSPKLPTPLRSTPGGAQSRPRIISSATYHGSLRMDSRLQPQMTLDISDESEAETVVDENVNPNPDRGFELQLNELEQEGNALQALRHAVAKRRGAVSNLSAMRPPARSRPGSSLKRSYKNSSTMTEQSSVIPPAIAKSLFALPPNLAPPPPLPLIPTAPAPQRKTLRRRRVIPDGGYSHPMKKSGSFSTISDPDFHASSTEEDEATWENDEVIRCICGMDQDGGTLMVQCDSCNNWLHLRCTGLNRKALPETYTCSFCGNRENYYFENMSSNNNNKARLGVRIGGGSASGSFRGVGVPMLSSSPIKKRMC